MHIEHMPALVLSLDEGSAYWAEHKAFGALIDGQEMFKLNVSVELQRPLNPLAFQARDLRVSAGE